MSEQLNTADTADAVVVTKAEIDEAVKAAEEALAQLEAPYQAVELARNELSTAERNFEREQNPNNQAAVRTASIALSTAQAGLANAAPRRVIDVAAQKLLDAREGKI